MTYGGRVRASAVPDSSRTFRQSDAAGSGGEVVRTLLGPTCNPERREACDKDGGALEV